MTINQHYIEAFNVALQPMEEIGGPCRIDYIDTMEEMKREAA